MSRLAKTYTPPTHDEIAAAARRLYETEGRPQGKAEEHWLRAETQLIAERKAQIASSPAKAPTKPATIPTPAASAGMQSQPASRQPLHRN